MYQDWTILPSASATWARCSPWRPRATGSRHGTSARGRPLIYALVAGRLLHVLDLFRQRRHRVPHRAGLPPHLSGADPGLRVGLEADPDDRRHHQAAQHRLHRGLPLGPLRQERGAGRAGRGHRGHRHRALHLDPAEGGVGLAAGADLRAATGRASFLRPATGIDGLSLMVAAHHGHFRHPVRHPPHRHDRAPGRHDPGHRGRIDREAGCLRRGRRSSWCSA